MYSAGFAMLSAWLVVGLLQGKVLPIPNTARAPRLMDCDGGMNVTVNQQWLVDRAAGTIRPVSNSKLCKRERSTPPTALLTDNRLTVPVSAFPPPAPPPAAGVHPCLKLGCWEPRSVCS